MRTIRINIKKIASITLASLILIGSTSGFAAGFKDIAGHWAEIYINRGDSLGFIKGYDDGYFRPDREIDRLQVMALSARLLNMPKAEVDKATLEHKDELLKNYLDIKEEWAAEDLSVALSEGIVTHDDLKRLYNDNGAKSLVSREEVAIYVARAMGVEKEVENKGSNILTGFADDSKIDKNVKLYVAVMFEHGILRGDKMNHFNPKAPITRAQMATVISNAYDYIEAN